MDASRLFDTTALLGILSWLLVSTFVLLGTVTPLSSQTATLAVGLAMLVVVPTIARLADLPIRTGRRSRWYRIAARSTLPAALAGLTSLFVPVGPVATGLAVPWLVVTVSLAIFGLQRALPNLLRPAELAIGVALLYLPVAGFALAFHRAGVTFGFGPTTMLLTVVHFHYAGSALPAFVGMLERDFETARGFHLLLGVVLIGPGLIGLGIAFSPFVELLAASVFAVVVVAVAIYTLALIRSRRRVGYALVGFAAVSVTVSMGVVVAYLVSIQTSLTVADFETMLVGHGWLNAVGFALVGIVGWRLVDPPSRAPPLGMPISRLTTRGRVGPDYLQRYDLAVDGGARGMVDGFSEFDGPDCDSDRIAPEVAAFYERTADYDLRIEPAWEPGFRLGARVYTRFSRRVEQMNFPFDERDPERLSSRIVTVDDRADGRTNVRSWIRTYDETDAAIYVAVYATHRLDGHPYMNIAFPLPWTNVTSVLAVEPLNGTDSDGVVLSTERDGDAGIYLRTPVGPLRIPMNETIRVWSDEMPEAFPDGFDDDGADLYARHEVSLFGRQFLRLDYTMTERVAAAAPTAG